MKALGLMLLIFLAGAGLMAQQADFEWAIQCNNPPNTTDTKTVLASGKDGGFYLAGEFVDTAYFGDESLISQGGTDISLVRFNSEGTAEWAIRIGGADYDYVQSICISGDGDIYMSGYFYGNTLIGTDSYTSFGSQDIFLASFSSSGDFQWSVRFGGPSADYVTALDVGPDENIVSAGYFYADMLIADTALHSSASSDIYLASFAPDGQFNWAVPAGGSSSDQLRDVSCDPQGSIYFTGSFYNDFTFADTTLMTVNPVGGYVARVSSGGQLEMISQVDGSYLTPEIFVEADRQGNYYLAGNFAEDILLGDSIFHAGQFNQDIFVAKYEAGGQWLWAGHGKSTYGDQLMGIDVDAYGNLYITGHTLDTIYFGQLMLPYHLCCGSREIFIVNYNPDGKVQWGKQITGPRASVQSIAMNGSGNLMLSGLFSDTLAFDDIDLNSYSGYRTYVTSLDCGILNDLPVYYNGFEQFTIYPNPAGDVITIRSARDSEMDFIIYNSAGQEITSGKYKPEAKIDISDLPGGMYCVMLTQASSQCIATGKFLKR